MTQILIPGVPEITAQPIQKRAQSSICFNTQNAWQETSVCTLRTASQKGGEFVYRRTYTLLKTLEMPASAPLFFFKLQKQINQCGEPANSVGSLPSFYTHTYYI